MLKAVAMSPPFQTLEARRAPAPACSGPCGCRRSGASAIAGTQYHTAKHLAHRLTLSLPVASQSRLAQRKMLSATFFLPPAPIIG